MAAVILTLANQDAEMYAGNRDIEDIRVKLENMHQQHVHHEQLDLDRLAHQNDERKQELEKAAALKAAAEAAPPVLKTESGQVKRPAGLLKSSTKDVRKIDQEGVPQWIYTNWIRSELDKENACLELPFTVLLLVSFAILALTHLGQQQVAIIEHAIVQDIAENANFAWAHNFGHKGIEDVNSFADFWSWTRLGFLPLVFPDPPILYSEGLQEAVPRIPGLPAYDVSALPGRRQYPGFRRKVPVTNDYLRYNRIIGGVRFRKAVNKVSDTFCTHPGTATVSHAYFGKSCSGPSSEELPPDLYATETFEYQGVSESEWFLSDQATRASLIQRAIDMEDGCTSARYQNRTCLCTSCNDENGEDHPWLNELTSRVEISFVLYNAQYGMYCTALVNFWFNRAGHIYKNINVRSSWASMMERGTHEVFMMITADAIWLIACLYVVILEIQEIFELIHAKNQPWYHTLANDYFAFWNIVDWISISIAFIIIAFFVFLHLATNQVNDGLAEHVRLVSTNPNKQHLLDQVVDFYKDVETMCNWERRWRSCMCFYPFFLMLRLFKSFDAQPRLAIVTDTFKTGATDLFHFCIVFSSVYFCMAVNAVLLFGQDALDFATLDRALMSCFRTMLGDWDWDAMKSIGFMKAFVWFSVFMVVMQMVLLNMLLAILMEAYSKAHDNSENAKTLIAQCMDTVRRFRQNRKKQRVRLNEIWDALLKDEDNDTEKLLENDRPITPSYLLNIVPSLKREQATRTLTNSWKDHEKMSEEPFRVENVQEPIQTLLSRMNNSVLCSAYMTTKLEQYHALDTNIKKPPKEEQEEEEEEPPEEASPIATSGGAERSPRSAGNSSPMSSSKKDTPLSPEEILRRGIESVRIITEERTKELSDGVAFVLEEEMQGLERRQKDQQKSMDQMQTSLHSVKQLVFKLARTCEEVAQLSLHDAGNADGNADPTLM